MVLKASAAVKRIEGSDGKGIVEGDMIVRVNGAAVTGGNDANRALRLAFKDQVVEEVVLTLMHLPDGHVAAAAGIDEPDVGQQVTSNFVQRVKASMNGVVKASEMVNFQRVCYRLYNGSSGSNMKHMCSALGIDVGTPAYMKMAIEIRLRDLQFSEWDVFVPTADDWQLRESDDEVHEKLLDITYMYTIPQSTDEGPTAVPCDAPHCRITRGGSELIVLEWSEGACHNLVLASWVVLVAIGCAWDMYGTRTGTRTGLVRYTYGTRTEHVGTYNMDLVGTS